MREHYEERIEQLLRDTLQPINSRAAAELRGDLWPAMLKRLEARPAQVPWFDWALLGAVVTWLLFFPGAIPVLFYHL
jgi:hypothetical protein